MKEDTAIDPNAVYRALISSQRNMFVSTTVAIALIGFSNTFSDNKLRLLMTALGSAILVISIIIGMSAAQEFASFMNHHGDLIPEYVPEGTWQRIPYLHYAFISVIAVFYITFTVVVFLQ